MRSFIESLSSLIFPTSCEVCNKFGTALCIPCSYYLSNSAKILSGYPSKIAAGIIYDEISSQIVLRAKENGIRSSQRALAIALSAACQKLELKTTTFGLVPLPSTAKSIRKRGNNFVLNLANEFIALNSGRYSITLVDTLRHLRPVKDQSGLSMQKRAQNMDHALTTINKITIPLLLLDDVITTGSTMKSAIFALNEGRATIIGGISACASPQQMRISCAGGGDSRQNFTRRRRPNS